MPEYTSTLLLTFILASCFYKKHIKDWWWFRIGLYAYVVSIVEYVLRAPDNIMFLRAPVSFMYTISSFVNQGAVLASGVAFVVACLRDVKRDLEHIRCLKCGYILKGLTEPRCPECGERI